MTVSTFSSAVHITPTVIKTFYLHSKRKARKLKDHDDGEEALDNIFFDEAFHIVKAFILLGTKNTVESLQAFTNTHVPAPFWAAVAPVRIPLLSCNRAADALIEWFGPQDLNLIVGGEKWWQVRGLDGIDAEWIAEKEHLRDEDFSRGKKLSDEEKNILKMEQLETVMLYVHGGGYFWGSINTHRYQIIRYAREMRGRAFAVNYRKAPQYPWPCPLQDILAAYLYLVDPPPDALHKAIHPSKIVFAGDSAGGGLALTVLTILRDLGMPLPAGAVLISPWVDLTHSFPSIMSNTATDIIPPHGFLSKPSVLWPIDLINDDGRVVRTQTNPPPKPGHADILWPEEGRKNESAQRWPRNAEEQANAGEAGNWESSDQLGSNEKPKSQEEMMAVDRGKDDVETTIGRGPESPTGIPDPDDIDFWQPKPPKVFMNNPLDVPLELRSQIQLYATTEQLSHPLVSPILQGSLGNLCPLYILTGDGEVLRDEVMYLAHRAAHPGEYPVREGVIRDGWRQKDNLERFTKPTKVHLQAFDGMCHVLTVFTFTESAKYAYRSIAEFAKHVTQHSPEHLERNPFPELHRPSSHTSPLDHDNYKSQTADSKKDKHKEALPSTNQAPTQSEHSGEMSDLKVYKENEMVVSDEFAQHDIPDVLMIRERVDIHGHTRPMEPKDQIAALRLKPSEIGIIKEGPLYKWLLGQKEWDQQFRRSAENALKKRRKQEAKAQLMLEHAREQGLLMEGESGHIPPRPSAKRSGSTATGVSGRATKGAIQEDRRWGPLDLADERPPPTAIAGRRDTPEALALIKKSIYHTAPATHKTVPKMKTWDSIRAAFDPHDDPFRPPQQSVSEQQVRSGIRQMHGMRVWESLLSYFMRKSSIKAVDGTRHAGDALMKTGGKIASIVTPDSGEK
ncbi:alpha/beta-hydrolase [Leucogyrophana mollusca]|uniref:Alpha/beta-hydrolase n=1 Tax=Leucogyrophana mollusca TaxID=85980 RepID=A0ACB8C0R4_9AGAM|nr:alpha/beta-hydrolase [Leucogyrophana mollusca]